MSESVALSPTKKGQPGNPNWRKGVSGNPGGKRRIPATVKDLAQAKTTHAIDLLVRAMESGKAPWSTRVRAAEIILERGHGRAPIAPEDQQANRETAFSLVAALQRISTPHVVSPPVIDVTPQSVRDDDTAK